MFLRTASERDLPAVRALLVETWHATYDAILGAEDVNAIVEKWHSIAALTEKLKRPNSEFIVADDGHAIGAMAYAAASDELKIVILQQIYVRPSFQRRGLGRQLLDEVEHCFPDASTLRLDVHAANTGAIAFYEANGFAKIGDAPNRGDRVTGMPALIMEKRIG